MGNLLPWYKSVHSSGSVTINAHTRALHTLATPFYGLEQCKRFLPLELKHLFIRCASLLHTWLTIVLPVVPGERTNGSEERILPEEINHSIQAEDQPSSYPCYRHGRMLAHGLVSVHVSLSIHKVFPWHKVRRELRPYTVVMGGCQSQHYYCEHKPEAKGGYSRKIPKFAYL